MENLQVEVMNKFKGRINNTYFDDEAVYSLVEFILFRINENQFKLTLDDEVIELLKVASQQAILHEYFNLGDFEDHLIHNLNNGYLEIGDEYLESTFKRVNEKFEELLKENKNNE